MALRRAKRSRRWWRRPGAIIAVSAVVVAAGGGIAAAVVLLAPKPVADRLVAASVGTFDQSVSASGTIEPATVANLAFSSAGTVTAVDVQIGQSVAVGQALASIDTSALQNQVALAQAELDQAQAQQSSASGGTSAQVAAAAQVASAQAKLQLAQNAVTQATLVSPIAGIVAAVNVWTGEQVGSSGTAGTSSGATRSSTTGSGSTAGTSAVTSSSGAVTVISPTAWIVDTTVGSADLVALKAGMQAQVTPTGASQPIFGTVQSIGVASTSTTAGVAQFPVKIALTGSPTGLYAGTVAGVSIITKELDDVMTVPTSAVRTENGQTVVTVSDGTTQQTVPVTVGQIFGTQTQITQGLSEGQQVVVASVSTRAGSGSGSFGGAGGSGGSGRGGNGFGGGSGRAGSGSGTSSGTGASGTATGGN